MKPLRFLHLDLEPIFDLVLSIVFQILMYVIEVPGGLRISDMYVGMESARWEEKEGYLFNWSRVTCFLISASLSMIVIHVSRRRPRNVNIPSPHYKWDRPAGLRALPGPQA